MKTWEITILPGDGIGPELIKSSMPILRSINKKFKISMKIHLGSAGYNTIKNYGTNLPESTIKLLKKSDCVVKGPMTTPEEPGSEISAAVKIRKMFELYADVRPVKTLPSVNSLKPNIDFVIVRENTEGMYSGLDYMVSKDTAVGLRVITKSGSERIGKFSLGLAKNRKKHLTIVHKGNILKISDGLFKSTIEKLHREGYKSILLDDAHVDAMAQWLIKKPEDYDVLVTENLFGDILSDEAAMLVGGVGVCPSANIGESFAMFEPVHGSAPKYAGMDKANPIATILSIKMMYEWMGYSSAARLLQTSVEKTLESGIKTYDIGGTNSLSEVSKAILSEILSYNKR
ncbi:MAG: isocitrate/isopropylmalate dehydrogenase family protein [Candidatus Marsarchaeota archaeon]|jgi:isopropylmalate/isohomocitrate dehydrogenase-like protein|nr:isocitrate/isopropylmalate dehydrogenase family protein [Candidatus Marsarchaeota archaeon]